MASHDVIVIGAGIAGLLVAGLLKNGGLDVLVLEKSRGFGGRSATKRLTNAFEGAASQSRADHGLRYLVQPNLNHSLADQYRVQSILVDHLSKHGVLREWKGSKCMTFHAADQSLHSDDELGFTKYVAPDGMSAIGKLLAKGLNVKLQHKVLSITRDESSHLYNLWVEDSSDGNQASLLNLHAKRVVFTTPAFQAHEIFTAPNSVNSSSFIPSAIVDNLYSVQYDPCITAMVQLDNRANFVSFANGRPWTCIEFPYDHPYFFWACNESSKRECGNADTISADINNRVVNITIHASPSYARTNFDATDLNLVGMDLFQHLFDSGLFIRSQPLPPSCLNIAVHKWKYSLPSPNPTNESISFNEDQSILFCGDYITTIPPNSTTNTLASTNPINNSIGNAVRVATSMLQSRGNETNNAWVSHDQVVETLISYLQSTNG